MSSLEKEEKIDKASGIFEVCGGVSLIWKDCVRFGFSELAGSRSKFGIGR